MGLDLDFGLYRKALAEGSPNGLRSVRLGVTGEPLLADSPEAWVAEAVGRGITDVSLITNGQLLSPEVSRRLVGAGLTRLMISVDAGSEEGYRSARPGGNFRRLTENIEAFLAVRGSLRLAVPVLRLSFVEREGTEAERELFRERFSPLADYLSFQSYSPILERGRLARSLGLGAERGSGVLSEGRERGSGGPPVGRESAEADGRTEKAVPGTASHPGVPRHGSPIPWCSEPFVRMCLYADGGLFPCCSDYGRLMPAARIQDTTIREAWHSSAAAAAREPGPPRHPACVLCRGQAGSLAAGEY
jgi:hypothetical protein